MGEKWYVGQSGDIAKRLEQHAKSGKLDVTDLVRLSSRKLQAGKRREKSPSRKEFMILQMANLLLVSMGKKRLPTNGIR